MDSLGEITLKTLESVGWATLILIIAIFLIKKFIANHAKIMNYVYITYFLFLLRFILVDFDILTTKQGLGYLYILTSLPVIKILDILINDANYSIKFLKNLGDFEFPRLVRSLIIVSSFVIILFFILKEYHNINLGPLLTTSAILSAVVGLALQDALTNFIAGIVLTSEKSFQRGDVIEIENILGRVIDTDWRSTRLTQYGGGVITIPNSNLIKQEMINYHKKVKVRLDIKIGTSYNDYPNHVEKTLLNIAKANKKIMKDPEPRVVVVGYNNFSIDYELRVWVKIDYYNRVHIESELYKAIWYAFKREGIKIPFPVRELFVPQKTDEHEILIQKETMLKKVNFLKELDANEINNIAKKTRMETFGKGEYICFEGDVGDSFYIIRKGKVDILISEKRVATLKEGDFFGEMSLLTGKKRNATIYAPEDIEVFSLNKSSFTEVIQENMTLLNKITEFLVKRENENAERQKEITTKRTTKVKNQEEQKKNILKKLIQFFEV